ncbi:MAG: histidine--tRNA ligase [Bacteroidales bacterium]|nr:histidine--tRNA ligase [Bacteroidales bacterium]
MQKPSIPKGTRDFIPEEAIKRNYIFDTIKSVFVNYGYEPIETPALENLSTLLGKYGDEGDKLLFKVLNSGDFVSKVDDALYAEKNSVKLSTAISEKGLRYDLTVPFARFVVQNFNKINFPFKRYQIQPVWRADRPQKGRYREFFQCDVDVVGSNSLLNEVELIQIIDEVFQKLEIRTVIKLNNRKILAGIAEYIGQKDKIIDITVAIDKLDKIGNEAVNKELSERGLADSEIDALQPVLHLSGSNTDKLADLKKVLANSEVGLEGIAEIEVIFDFLAELSFESKVELDLTLARGLNYYTGAIIEVKALDVQIGSICGGGRYDDLTGVFGKKDLSGVGVSFGADRIYDVLNQQNNFPEKTMQTTQAMIVNFGDTEVKYALKVAFELRRAGIKTEIYPDSTKMKKQMTYADKKNIPFVILIGENEMNENKISVKNMLSGEQDMMLVEDFIKKIH